MSRFTRYAAPVALALALVSLVACSKKEAVPEEETAKLIQPVAREQTADAAPAGAAAAAGPVNGKQIFETVCAACHTTGAAGAPKAGDKGAWGPRIAQGKDALYKSALNGKNAMPAKGGNPSLSDEAVKAAVDHLIGLAK